nr:integrase, catalytic region, zinc finger, CCHC-type, peptidase aspartic, catalytic [Tanacetum cinerariifolium]
MYLKKAQSEKPCLYEIPNNHSDPTNRLVPDREETLTLAEESRSKLNKDFVRPYDYTRVYYVEGLNHNLFSVGQFCNADLEVAFRKSTCFVKDLQGNDLLTEMSETSVANDTSGLVPQQQKAPDYDNSDPVPQLQNVSPSADTKVPSQQELDLLFGPLYDEFFTTGSANGCNLGSYLCTVLVSNSDSLSDSDK